MYISNPKPPMGTFVYSANEVSKIDNPIEFVNNNSRAKFLKDYSLERDIPMIVFGEWFFMYKS